MAEMSVRQWQERFRAGDFSSRDRAVQCEAGWYDWFCRDEALAGHLKRISKVVLGINAPFILDNYYVWFKNNCPMAGPLYDDVRFEPLSGERGGKHFVVSLDCPHELAKWVLYTERYGYDAPEFCSGNVRNMVQYINGMASNFCKLHYFSYLMEYSCLKTLASKHKTSLSKIIDKFNDGTGKWGVPYETKLGNKRRYFANYADCKGKGSATDYIWYA